MYELKEGKVLRPFGPKSKIEGKVSTSTMQFLISRKLAKASDFSKVKEESQTSKNE